MYEPECNEVTETRNELEVRGGKVNMKGIQWRKEREENWQKGRGQWWQRGGKATVRERWVSGLRKGVTNVGS